jgi:hypothetical protein
MQTFMMTVVLCAVPDSVFENGSKWQAEEVDGVLTVESRPVVGTAFSEFRVSTVTDLPASLLCDSVFERATKGERASSITLRKLVRDGTDERVVYAQVEAPMISRRDYAMTMRRQRLTGGSCQVRFKTTNEQAPALPPDFVRMENLWGSWLFEPLTDGKTRITHVLFADPGGSVPPFMARGGQKSSTKENVLLTVSRVREAQAVVAPR